MATKKVFWILPLMLLFLAGFGHAWKMFSADEPIAGLTGNSFVDILYFDGIIWMASGNGLSYSLDFGQTWNTQNSSTGMNSNEPSAIFARPSQIWVAGTHSEDYQGISYPFGNGINRSYDGGVTWENMTPVEATSFAHLVYDLSGSATATFAACFHGGLIVNQAGDTTWTHLFYSPADSADWAADNWADLATGRYYSVLVDTLHADTMIVYGGSAHGINKFLYIPRRVKMGGNVITALAGTDYIYAAHENGISQCDTSLTKFYTSNRLNGLPINSWTRRLTAFGGRVWAAEFNKTDSTGLGLYYIDSPNEPWTFLDSIVTGVSHPLWTKLDPAPFEGVYDFKGFNDSVLFVAAGDSGIFQSLDSGMTWQRFFIDSSDTDLASLRNQVLSVDCTADSLYLGTRGGLVKAAYSQPFTIDFDTVITFPESDSTGSVVSVVRHFQSNDTVFTWVGLMPHPDSGGIGNYSALQIFNEGGGEYQIAAIYSGMAGGPSPTIINDIIPADSFTVFATSSGLLGNFNVNRPTLTNFSFTPYDDSTGLTLANYRFYTAMYNDDRLYAGSAGGFGYRRSQGDWKIVRANTSPVKHDLAIARTRGNSNLPGDWIIALETQERATDTLLWSACRAVSDTIAQYNAVGYSSDFGDSWTRVLTDQLVWNLAFDANGGMYAAASSGLYYAPDDPDVWYRANIIDPTTLDTIWAETSVYSVEVVDSIVWVGTSFGLAFRPVDNFDDWKIIRIFKDTDSIDDLYAAPVPFSPLDPNGRLTLHYRVEESADISVDIYDFSMNLVKSVTRNKYRPGGADYFESWDGYNEDGDVVATGMYFFKVTYSTGQERWGRLAIIP